MSIDPKVSAYFSEIGKRGGKSAGRTLTPDQLRDRARRGGIAKARNAKRLQQSEK